MSSFVCIADTIEARAKSLRKSNGWLHNSRACSLKHRNSNTHRLPDILCTHYTVAVTEYLNLNGVNYSMTKKSTLNNKIIVKTSNSCHGRHSKENIYNVESFSQGVTTNTIFASFRGYRRVRVRLGVKHGARWNQIMQNFSAAAIMKQLLLHNWS